MSRATPDEQLRFLISCVKYSDNGKVDFVEVAQECCIVSRGAAAKRYERLLKNNGINPSGGPNAKSTAPNAPKKRKNNAGDSIPKPAAKKRQTESNMVKKQDDAMQSHNPGQRVLGQGEEKVTRPKIESEPAALNRVELRAPPRISVSPPQQHFEQGLQQTRRDEDFLNFNDFCSPEFFADCDPETSQPCQPATCLPTPVSQASPMSLSTKPTTPTPSRKAETIKEEEPEWETVWIRGP